MSTLHWLRRHCSLLEALSSAELRAAEKDVLLYIAPQSVGYRREDTRHYVSEGVLAKKTGRAPSTVSADEMTIQVSPHPPPGQIRGLM